MFITVLTTYNCHNAQHKMVADNIFGDLDKMITDFEKDNAATKNSSSIKTASSLDIKTSLVSFRQMKRSISRAEKCGHSQQELHVLPPSMVYFYCGKCDKKTFVENPTDDAAEDDKPQATLEIDLDVETLEEEEMLLKEVGEKPEWMDTWEYYHQDCRVMFTDYKCRDHMEAVINLGGSLKRDLEVNDTDVIVTDRLRLTTGLLMSIGKGIPVVSPAWLLECQYKRMFVNPWYYTINDQYKAKLYGFNIKSALVKREHPCLKGLKLFISDKNKKNRYLAHLGDIIKEHGGVIEHEDEGKVDIAIIENSEPETRSKFEPTAAKIVDKLQFFVGLLRGKDWDILGKTRIEDSLLKRDRTIETVAKAEEEHWVNGNDDGYEAGDESTKSDVPAAKRKKGNPQPEASETRDNIENVENHDDEDTIL